MKVLVPIIGMHRSGTSAVAGALANLSRDWRQPAAMPPAIEGDDHPCADRGQCDCAYCHLHELPVAQR